MESKLFDGGSPIKIGDQELVASILTDRDYADLDEYIRSKFIKMASDASKSLDEEQARSIMSVALKDAINVGWGTEEGFDIIGTKDGILHLGFQMCRKRQRMTFTQFEEIAKRDLTATLQSITEVYSRMNIVKEDTQGGVSTGSEKSV